jgi:hypothetical protein
LLSKGFLAPHLGQVFSVIIGLPQFPQNLFPSGTWFPQLRQGNVFLGAIFAPQLPQNLFPSGFSELQEGHKTIFCGSSRLFTFIML